MSFRHPKNIEDLAKGGQFDKRKGYDDVALDQIEDSKPTKSTDSMKQTGGSRSLVVRSVAPKSGRSIMSGVPKEKAAKGVTESPTGPTPQKSPLHSPGHSDSIATTPKTPRTPRTPRTQRTPQSPAAGQSITSLVNETTRKQPGSSASHDKTSKKCCTIV